MMTDAFAPTLRRILALSLCLGALCVQGGEVGVSEVRVAGAPDPASMGALHEQGIRLIVDLRTPGEGVSEEAVAAGGAGIRYVNLPVGRDPAAASVVERLGALLEATDGGVLLHCRSGNRAGEVWARHLLASGTALEDALAAGRAAGLKEAREAYVREAPELVERSRGSE